MKRSIRLLSTVILLTLLLIVPAKAQQTNQNAADRITLSPAVVRPEFNTGQVSTGKLTVINDGDEAYDFIVYSRPYSVQDETYEQNFTEVNERTEAYQWIQFNETRARLLPGQRKDIFYTVRVPARAEPGGHYAVLFAETQPPDTGEQVVARKKRVGALAYMTVKGEMERKGNLVSWRTDFWQRSSPLTALLRLRNTGTVHYQANTNIEYRNILNKKVHNLNQELLVIPGTTRRIVTPWVDSPSFGIYKVGGSVTFLGKTEQLPYKYILALPLSGLIILLAVLMAIGIVLRLRFKRKSNTKRNRRR